MIILTPSHWSDYELLDSGNGQRLERFGPYITSRPDPQAIWQPNLPETAWQKASAVFEKSGSGSDNGKWVYKTKMPEKWLMTYKNLSFFAKLTPFKHTGVFPEQSVQWDFIQEKIKSSTTESNILNLFGYTGIATLAAAEAGSRVTHVDASKSSIAWARENQTASSLEQKPIRWILDDALKFVQREVKRGVTYDGIIMDPPIYGHGPHGETWKLHEHLPILLNTCRQVLSKKPLFIIINAYAVSSSALMLCNVLTEITKGFPGIIEYGELALKENSSERLLSTGIFARWQTIEQ